MLSNLYIDFSKIDPYPAELYTSIIVMVIILIVCIIVKIKSRHVDPLVKPKGIMLLAEMFVGFVDNTVKKNMGRQFVKYIAPMIGFMMTYLFMSFISGLFGLPSPINYYLVPLTLALVTFLMIHIVSAYYTKWKYFKRYVSPFALFLPINLMSMWAPLLSLSFRLFGNAIAGWIILKIIYGVFETLQVGAVNLGFVSVFITPALHAYFDLFSAFIQTTVFTMLTMLLVNAEVPDENQQIENETTEMTISASK